MLRSFDFSLDPGTGPITVAGTLDGVTLTLAITSAGTTRTETRTLDEPPALMLSLARRLASEGLAEGRRHHWVLFDPATMRNAPVEIAVAGREVVRANDRPLPAFRVELSFGGLETTAWVTDTGEVVREESPLGLLTVVEPPDRARALAVPRDVQVDLLAASAVVPVMKGRIEDPRDVRRLVCASKAPTCRARTCRASANALTATSSNSPTSASCRRHQRRRTWRDTSRPNR